ncbi:MAG: hypothetical protein IBJ18_03660 [Phycisphaerales bacterium]|nr:hypothetical protein [Phycisphaerales bacterium]
MHDDWRLRNRLLAPVYVAEFCFNCEQIRPHTLHPIEGHLRFIHMFYKIDEVPIAMYTICLKCSRTKKRKLGVYSAALFEPHPIETLIAQTNPSVVELAERVASLPDRIERGAATEQDIEYVFFRWLEIPDVEDAYTERLLWHLDWKSAMCLLFASVPCFVALADATFFMRFDLWHAAGFLVSIVLWIVISLRTHASSKNWVRTSLEPRLAQELAPLKPGVQALARVIEKAHPFLARNMSAGRVCSLIAAR